VASVRDTPYGTYDVMYRDPSGRQRSKSLKRKTDATRYARAVETDKLRQAWTDPRLTRATFGQYAADWWTSVQLRPSTLQLYEGLLLNWVLPRFGDTPISAIDAPTLRTWAKEITDSGRSASHRAACINIVRLVMNTVTLNTYGYLFPELEGPYRGARAAVVRPRRDSVGCISSGDGRNQSPRRSAPASQGHFKRSSAG